MTSPTTRHGVQPRQWLTALITLLTCTGAALAAPAAPPTWQGVWAGQLGSQRVVVALYTDPDTGRWSGRYFYERFGRDLSLWGPSAPSATADTLKWLECPPDYSQVDAPCEHPTGSWSLSRPQVGSKGALSLQGSWTPAGLPGRRPPPASPIVLQRVADYVDSAEAFRDPYEQRRQRGTQGRVRSGGHLGPVAWQQLTDTRSKVSTPQFTQGASAEVLARINQQLKTQWQERTGEALSAVDYDDELTVAFANPHWLALTYSLGSYYAGAAHPSNTFSATTYDLSTGQKVNWSQWFRFAAPGTTTLDINRKDLLAAQVMRALTASLAKRSAGQSDDADSCAQTVLEHYECQGGRCASGELTQGQTPPSWTLWPTTEGLAVATDIYSEVERGCRGEHVVLPWKQAQSALLRPRTLP
jgi:hypothetical protein